MENEVMLGILKAAVVMCFVYAAMNAAVGAVWLAWHLWRDRRRKPSKPPKPPKPPKPKPSSHIKGCPRHGSVWALGLDESASFCTICGQALS